MSLPFIDVKYKFIIIDEKKNRVIKSIMKRNSFHF